MKYLLAFVLGLVLGAATCVLFIYYNPMLEQRAISPLSVSENEVMQLRYSAAARDALLYTNNGEAQVAPHPPKVLQLWEPTVRRTTAMATVLGDSRNEIAGIGIKFYSDSEKSSVLNGAALVDAVWHIYLPGQGSFFIEQTENYWDYLRNVVIPARLSSGDNWRGIWRGNVTVGPTALGTGRVAGGSGEFATLAAEAIESLAARAYSVQHGPVAVDGELFIEMPAGAAMQADPDAVP